MGDSVKVLVDNTHCSPALRAKRQAEMKTNFAFYIHFYKLAWFQCFFILVSFLYIEVFNREKKKKETF